MNITNKSVSHEQECSGERKVLCVELIFAMKVENYLEKGRKLSATFRNVEAYDG